MSKENRIKQLLSVEVICWGIFLLFLAVVVIARLRLLQIPLERDEGEYAYFGQLMLQGIPSYKLAYTMKLPGTHAAYAVFMAIFGQTAQGIHLGFLFMNLASVALVFLISKRLFGFIAGIFAAVSYALLSVGRSILGVHAHATHFVMFMALCGLWVLLKAVETEKKTVIFVGGLFFGLAILMKQPGFIFFPVGLFYISWRYFKKHASFGPDAALQLAVYTIGAALPFAALCLALFLAGAFDAFWFWTFRYVFEYSSDNPLRVAPLVFWDQFKSITGSFRPVWYIAAAGAPFLFINTQVRKHALFVVALLAASFVATCPGFLFRRHYFVVLLPVVSMLAGICVSSCYSFVHDRERLRSFSLALLVLFAGILLWSVSQQKQYLFERSPLEVSRQTYGFNPFIESVGIAEYLKAHSSPDDTIAVLGSEPQIYFYSQRHSATGYIYTYPLMENQPYALAMRKEMMREIELKDPRYIVYVHVYASWIWNESQKQNLKLEWAEDYMYQRYDKVGVVDIAMAGTRYYWDAGAENVKPESPLYVLVLKRKPTAVQRSVGILMRKGIEQDLAGNRGKAVFFFKQALKLDRMNAELCNGLGYLYYKEGDAKKAEGCFRRALEADPGYEKAKTNLRALQSR